MGDVVNRVRRDYTAKKQSGKRSLSAIKYFVIHDAEAPLPESGAEAVGRYFASSAARGSTQFGVDNDSTQRYLEDNIIAWGAPPLNVSGLHVECMGKASFNRDRWLREYGPMFKRVGWLVENRCRRYNIPLKVLTTAELKKLGTSPARGGIVTHASVSAAFKESTHTDPGDGFPMDVLMAWAHKYRQGRIKGRLTKPVLHLYCKGRAVTNLQKKLAAKGIYKGTVDGVFGKTTETAVKVFQKRAGIDASGVVAGATWKALAK